MQKKKTSEDTYSYSGWLNSDKLIKRSFAVMGHYIFAQLVLGLGILIIFIILTILGFEYVGS